MEKNDLYVEKEVWRVEINLALKNNLEGEIFLFPEPDATIFDRVAKLYEEREHYIPFRLFDSGKVIQLTKKSIAYFKFSNFKIKTFHQDENAEFQNLTTLRIPSKVFFLNDHEIKGVIVNEKRGLYNRLSDSLNRANQVIHLETENDTYLITHHFVSYILEIE